MLVPVLFTFLLYIVSPQNMLPVLKTETGRALLLAAAVLQGIGALTIRAMLKQDILG
jgi:Flp pilus assembly protein TadB